MNVWRNADGKIIVDADGKPIICEDCPCCPNVETLSLTFSGLTNCAGCIPSVPITVTSTSGLNGVHTLTGGAGTWTLADVGAWTVQFYNDLGDPPCSHPTGSASGTFIIRIDCVGGVFVVTVTGYSCNDSAFLGAGELDEVISNTVVCGDGTMMSGGTATVSL